MKPPAPGIETILAEAVEIASAAERKAFLDRACGGDPALRERVGKLAAGHFKAGSFLEHSPAAPTADFDPAAGYLAAGVTVGPYRVRELIGEGGMGLVYVADQEQPVRRRVALKVIKPGMDTREVVARFEAERQALALMDHPGIAKVFDGGATAEGRPYFVMELVRGLPVTEYCDRARLPARNRLALVVDVCRAMQHAHQKGVIHRDLKPSNILVTVIDGRPVPRVIDFGVAKATGGRLTDKTVYTGFARLVGTPLYMSPEQAELSGVDVDTRSDVYSLGVLLYELLTGTTPFDGDTLRAAGFDEMRRIIREEEPPRPSHRVSTLGAEARSTVSARRGLDERQLGRLLRGDLDWVVMKALEKDRNRRYESAGALAVDVERYLADEPVEARSPSAAYRLQKFARRNRRAVVTAAVAATALVAGTAVSAWQAVEANRARTLAEERRRDEADARADADAEKQRAAESLHRARAAVKQMLTRVAIEEVGEIPQMQEIRRRLLEDALGLYTELLLLNPRDAQSYYERGEVHVALSHTDSVIRDVEKALELDPNNATYHNRLAATLCWGKEDYHRAIVHATRAIQLDPKRGYLPFEGVYLVLIVAHHKLGQANEAREALRSYIELADGPAAISVATAAGHTFLDEFEKALPHALRAVELEPGWPQSHYALARSLEGLGDNERAFAAVNEAIRLSAKQDGIIWSRHAYVMRGNFHLQAGRHAAGVADYTTMMGRSAPDSHLLKRRALAHFHLGNYQSALADIASAVELLPTDASNLWWIDPTLVAACPDAGFRKGILDQTTRAIALTNGSPDSFAARAELYTAMKEDAKARDDMAKAIAGYRRQLGEQRGKPGPDHNNTQVAMAGMQAYLGFLMVQQNRYAEAEPLLRECLATREKLIPDQWLRFNAVSLLGEALLGQGKYAEAEPMLLAGYKGMKEREKAIPPEVPRVAEAAGRLVRLYEATGRAEDARAWRAKLPRELAPPPRPAR